MTSQSRCFRRSRPDGNVDKSLKLVAIFTMLVANFTVAGCWTSSRLQATRTSLLEEVSCFNTMLSISCPPQSVIVFESARYGRNDTTLAARCAVPYTRHCDVDVHFLMNRECSGRRRCSLAVNTATFGDPCGYDEFLRVHYRCVAVAAIHSSCTSVGSAGASVPPALFGSGFLSSPNYPDKYYMDAVCSWRVGVQRTQSIRFTIYDFELDIKRAGRCKDFVEISSPPDEELDSSFASLPRSETGVDSTWYDGRKVPSAASTTTYFRDCGALGRDTISVNTSVADFRFVVDASSLTQRGFLVYFEASGSGCSDLEAATSATSDVAVVYYFEPTRGGSELRANASCRQPGYVFRPLGDITSADIRPRPAISVYCTGVVWNETVPNRCVEPVVMATPADIMANSLATETTLKTVAKNFSFLSSSTSVVGLTLGAISVVMVIVLVISIVIYCVTRHRSRPSPPARAADIKWRLVHHVDDVAPDVCLTAAAASTHRRTVVDRCKVCAMNGYGCVDTEYAWYHHHQQQQQQQPRLVSPYTSLLSTADGQMQAYAGAELQTTQDMYVYPGKTPVDYCPDCVALYASDDATNAAVSQFQRRPTSTRRTHTLPTRRNPATTPTTTRKRSSIGSTLRAPRPSADCRDVEPNALSRSAPDLLFTVSAAAGRPVNDRLWSCNVPVTTSVTGSVCHDSVHVQMCRQCDYADCCDFRQLRPLIDTSV